MKRLDVTQRACILLLVALPSIVVTFCRVQPAYAANGPAKKLIEFGWDTPFPQQLHDHLADWQNRPFDGIVFSLTDNGGEIFTLQTYDPLKIHSEILLLKGLHWGRFTDNFLQLTVASNMDWTSDSDWKTILAHAELCAEAAKAAGCKGFVFDPEPYGATPWDFRVQKNPAGLSFAQYQLAVHQRGIQFMRVLQHQIPDAKVLTFYQYSLLLNELGPIGDANARETALSTNGYGLYPAFLDGMLEAARPKVQFIDGNERAYAYEDPTQFFSSYDVIHHDAAMYVDPGLREKYARQVRVAQAVYTDLLFNLRPDAFKSNRAIQMSPEQRDQWFESNLYYAFQSSDEYVWLYSETLHWWPNEEARPPGMDDAINTVRDKVRTGQPLGFDILSTMTEMRLRKLLTAVGL